MSAITRNKPKTAPINPTKPLRVARREIFAQHVARGVSVRDAYCLAGYVGRDPSSITGIRRAPDVAARVNYLLERRIEADTRTRHRAEKKITDARLRLIRELERIAYSDIRDVVQWDREPELDGEGNVIGFRDTMKVRPSHLLTREQAAQVRSTTTKSGALKFEIYDKLPALIQLAKILGMSPEPQPQSVNNATVNVRQVNIGETKSLDAMRRLAFAIAKVAHAQSTSGAAANAPRKEQPEEPVI
jgi:hypothetical protein